MGEEFLGVRELREGSGGKKRRRVDILVHETWRGIRSRVVARRVPSRERREVDGDEVDSRKSNEPMEPEQSQGALRRGTGEFRNL